VSAATISVSQAARPPLQFSLTSQAARLPLQIISAPQAGNSRASVASSRLNIPIGATDAAAALDAASVSV
jgi:hypothetical protein